MLSKESDQCDNDHDDSDDDAEDHEDTGEEEKLICGSDIDGNELSNADVDEDGDISEDRDTIDSQAETEAIDHIVTPSSARRCHQETLLLTTLLPIMLFIIQR